jgi:hypothetical protein
MNHAYRLPGSLTTPLPSISNGARLTLFVSFELFVVPHNTSHTVRVIC